MSGEHDAQRAGEETVRGSEDDELRAALRDCRDPLRQRLGLIFGLLGAFAAGGVVFLGVTRASVLRGWAGLLLAGAVLGLGLAVRRGRKS